MYLYLYVFQITYFKLKFEVREVNFIIQTHQQTKYDIAKFQKWLWLYYLVIFKKLKNVRVNETLIVKIEKDVNAIDTNRKGRKQWALVFLFRHQTEKETKKQHTSTHKWKNNVQTFEQTNKLFKHKNKWTSKQILHKHTYEERTNEQMIIRLLQKKLIELQTLMIQMTSVILGFQLIEKSSWNKIFYLVKNIISCITYIFLIR
jgi:hypothetical protein